MFIIYGACCPVTPLLATSTQQPSSIVGSSSLFSEIQALLKYWHTLRVNDPFRNLLYFPSYQRMTFLGILLLIMPWPLLYSVIPSRVGRVNSRLTTRETQLSPPRNYLSLMYSFGPRPITSPYTGSKFGVRCVCSSRLPTVQTSLWRFRLLCIYVQYTHLWNVCTTFGIIRNGTCDKTL